MNISLFCRFAAAWIVVTTLTLPQPGQAANGFDIVRIEPGKHSRAVIYQHWNGEYQSAVNLSSSSRTDNFSPSVIRLQNGAVMVVWVEATGVESSALRYRVLPPDAGDFSIIATITTPTVHHASPMLVRGLRDEIWCIWTGFDGDDDEIYFIRYRDNQWFGAARLDPKNNQVPDIQPLVASIGDDRLTIRWKTFSFEISNYTDVESTAAIASDGTVRWSEPQSYVVNPLEARPVLPDYFAPPTNLTEPDSVSLYFTEFPSQSLRFSRLVGGRQSGAD